MYAYPHKLCKYLPTNVYLLISNYPHKYLQIQDHCFEMEYLSIFTNGKHLPRKNPQMLDILLFHVSLILVVGEKEAVGPPSITYIPHITYIPPNTLGAMLSCKDKFICSNVLLCNIETSSNSIKIFT